MRREREERRKKEERRKGSIYTPERGERRIAGLDDEKVTGNFTTTRIYYWAKDEFSHIYMAEIAPFRVG